MEKYIEGRSSGRKVEGEKIEYRRMKYNLKSNVIIQRRLESNIIVKSF